MSPDPTRLKALAHNTRKADIHGFAEYRYSAVFLAAVITRTRNEEESPIPIGVEAVGPRRRDAPMSQLPQTIMHAKIEFSSDRRIRRRWKAFLLCARRLP